MGRTTAFRNAVFLVTGLFLGATAATCSQPKKDADAAGEHGGVASAMTRALVPAPAFARNAKSGLTLADVAERTVPSVVNIAATKMVAARTGPVFSDPLFRQFFGRRMAPREREEHSLGSGVIVSADGVILTNNHVVSHASELKVTLSDGRDFPAKVVATDPQSDIAVVKLEKKVPNLKPLKFGNSDDMRLGDVVLAIGDPFGIGETVTMGIISATGRSNLKLADYEDFIQTDAAINPGNSGGALVNMNGQLIGVNTAILSRTGGYQGIGFAIPSNMAHSVMHSLLVHGEVIRGWIGAGIQTLNDDLAKALGLSVQRGVLISDVVPGGPAAKAGLQRGDVIIKFNGEKIAEAGRLKSLVATTAPGTKVTIEFLRGKQHRTVQMTLARRPKGLGSSAQLDRSAGLLSGLTVSNLDAAARDKYRLPRRIKGVVVTGIQPGSAAAQLGLRPGDVIMEVNRNRVDSVAGLRQLAHRAGKSVALLVYRDGVTMYLVLNR